ncbi:hypothetical protein ACP4OV_001245 [Aristida adscensionis]
MGIQSENDLDQADVHSKDLLQQRLQDERNALPIYKFRDELLKAIEQYQVIIILGETGSGTVACTQPHQEVALDVAVRVSHEMGVNLGHEVGYSVRFDHCTSENTIINVIMNDEVYERTLSSDMLLALMKDIICFRPHLKLLISSADLDAEKFSGYFNSAPILKIPGRQYPVQIHYTKAPVTDFTEAAIATVLKIHVMQPPGDILVFLTGTEEIETFDEILKYRTRGLGKKMSEPITCPIYTNLPTKFQAKIFEPTPEGARKVIASMTLRIILFQRFNEPVLCLGIHDLVNFDYLDPPPSQTLMMALEQLYALSAMNCHGQLTKTGGTMAQFPLNPMLSKMIVASDKYKSSYEVITIASMLLVSNSIFHCPKDKLVHADDSSLKFHTDNVGDHIALLNIYNSWKETDYSTQWHYDNYIQVDTMKRARRIRDQLEALLKRVGIEICSNASDLDGIKKAITSGFFYHVARLQNNGYVTVKKPRTVDIHPSSGLALVHPQFVILHEIVETTKEYMRQVTEINPEWLVEIAPHYYQLKDLDGCLTGYQRTHESLDSRALEQIA